MRTLVYCTAFAPHSGVWNDRHLNWVEALRKSRIDFEQILIVDDGSQYLPRWPFTDIVNESDATDAAVTGKRNPLRLFHFERPLGRAATYDFPGWYRSFAYGARYGAENGFDKIVHLESDAYLISARMQQFVNDLDDGWTALWSEKYQCPEMAIQIVGRDQIERFAQYFSQDYSHLRGKNHEMTLPYTRICKEFVGDRYGETLADIPTSADYACQVQGGRESSYYWWIPKYNSVRIGDEDERHFRTLLNIDFSEGGDAERYLAFGWSRQEEAGRWTTGDESALILPTMIFPKSCNLAVTARPCLNPPELPRQYLRIWINDALVHSGLFDGDAHISAEIPDGVLRSDRPNTLRLQHPDAAAPAALTAGSRDARRLGFWVRAITVRYREPVADPLE